MQRYDMSKKALIFVLVNLFAQFTFSDSINRFELEDQFGVKTTIDTSVEWIIFSDDKEISDKINTALDELKITDIAALKGAYVAEISKMPSLITKMFALSKCLRLLLRCSLFLKCESINLSCS